MSEESINPPSTKGMSFYAEIIYEHGQGRMKVKIYVNLYISHKLDTWSRDLSTDFTLGSC